MNRIPLSLKFITGFSIAGLLFSGYLSVVKLFSGICAVNEGCPYFLGLPTCYYGFAIYVALTVLAITAIRQRITFHKALTFVTTVAFLGVLFAGYFSIREFPVFMQKGFASYAFGAPTCLFGLVFYMLIFASAALGLAHHRAHEL